MAEESYRKRRGPSDATDYSSSQAPETQERAGGRHDLPTDERLVPGGSRGADAEQGMPALDRDGTFSGGDSTGQTDFGATEDKDRK